MPRHIEQRRLSWYAVLNVPSGVQETLKRKRFRTSLKTRDKKVAERLGKPIVAEWQRQIALARGEDAAKNDAKFWRDALRRAKTEEQRHTTLEQIDAEASDIGAINVENIGDPPSSNPEAQRFYAEATGAIVSTTEFLDEWLTSLQVKDKTAKMRRATIGRLADKFPMLNDVSRKEVRRWVTELRAELKAATVQRMMSDCRTYWAYLEAIEVVPEDSAPFNRLGLKSGGSSSWLPYTPEEAVRLRKAAEGDAQLADVIRMAMYTGARREELCSLKVEHVKEDRFEIVDAKTKAGVRTVPTHRHLSKTIERLVKDSEDGYVLSGLKPNANGDRGDAIGKRFSRLKRSLGFSDLHTFHSWRGTVITMLERAGVPESTVQDIVGHQRSTLTGRTYSGKSTFEMRRNALDKLAY
jgi:integrase